MSEVVRLGGFGTSVTPVSQFYFQQAYLNVTLGKWEKINPGYGNMVLGYFGRTPVEPDPEIVRLASEQLGKPIFKDDPLDVLEPGIPKAADTLRENLENLGLKKRRDIETAQLKLVQQARKLAEEGKIVLMNSDTI